MLNRRGYALTWKNQSEKITYHDEYNKFSMWERVNDLNNTIDGLNKDSNAHNELSNTKTLFPPTLDFEYSKLYWPYHECP